MVYKKLFILLSLCLPLLSNQEYLIDGEYRLYLTIQDDEPYSANLELKTKKDRLSGKVTYPAYGCEGNISLKKIENKKLYLKEHITKKADICESGEYVFDISDHHIKRLKSYTLENKPYTGTITKNLFKIDESIKRCQDINSNFDKKEFLSKNSYDKLYICQRWSIHVDDKYLTYYEKLLSASVKTKKDAKHFLKQFSDSSYTKVVSEKLEKLYYKDAKDINSIDIYLAKYPSGDHVAELQKRKEELVYQQKNYTIDGLEAYLQLYPKGIFDKEARSKLISLKKEREKAEKLAAIKAKKKQEQERKKRLAIIAWENGIKNLSEMLKKNSIDCEEVGWSGKWDGIYPKGDGRITCSRYIGSSIVYVDINTKFIDKYRISSGSVDVQIRRGILFGLMGSDKGKVHSHSFENIGDIKSLLPNLKNLAIDSFNEEIKKYRNSDNNPNRTYCFDSKLSDDDKNFCLAFATKQKTYCYSLPENRKNICLGYCYSSLSDSEQSYCLAMSKHDKTQCYNSSLSETQKNMCLGYFNRTTCFSLSGKNQQMCLGMSLGQ